MSKSSCVQFVLTLSEKWQFFYWICDKNLMIFWRKMTTLKKIGSEITLSKYHWPKLFLYQSVGICDINFMMENKFVENNYAKIYDQTKICQNILWLTLWPKKLIFYGISGRFYSVKIHIASRFDGIFKNFDWKFLWSPSKLCQNFDGDPSKFWRNP